MKYRAVIEGIDPEPERVYQGTSNHIQNLRDWAHANLERLDSVEPQRDCSKAVAVIYKLEEIEVERIEKNPVVDPELKDQVIRIVEDINRSVTKEGQEPLTLAEISDRLKVALDKTGKKDNT